MSNKSPIADNKPEGAKPEDKKAEAQAEAKAAADEKATKDNSALLRHMKQEAPDVKAKRIQSRAEALATEFYHIKGSLCDYGSLPHNEKGFWHSMAARQEKSDA